MYLITFILLISMSAFTQKASRYEIPPVRRALEVIPEWMVNGEYWTVENKITSYNSLHQFRVKSRWYDFEVYGEPMLRIRLKELTAIGALKEYTTEELVGNAALDGATRAVQQTVDVVTHPVETIKATPKGIVRLFKKIAYDVVEVAADVVDVAGEIKEGEDDRAIEKVGEAGRKYGKRWLGVEFQERLWAQRLGIDPYTSNQMLRQELSRVAAIDAGTKFGVSLVNPIPQIGVIALLSDIYKVVWEKDQRELIEWIGLRLREMDVKFETINKLVYSEALPPGHLTLMVSALMLLENVEKRNIVVSQAALLETEAEGMFFLECVVMAAWFHTNQTPLKQAVQGTLIPVFLTQDDRLIAFSAADWAYWTELTATTAQDFTQVYAEYPQKRELWVSDQVSQRFITGIDGLGWKVRAGIRISVLPLIPWGLGNQMTRSGIPVKEK